MYGYSHDQNGPWAGRKLGTDDYYKTPSEALEGGRAMHYHAGQADEEKGSVWIAKLESVEVADFLIEGLVIFLADMKERAIVEFQSGGEALEFWLSQYSPIDAYAPSADPEDAVASFTRLFDLNFGRMIDFQSDGKHWPIASLTRVMKGQNGGFLKLEVQWNQVPKWNW